MIREIPGTLLVESPSAIVRGLCNHTRKPLYGSVLVVESLDPGCYDAIVASSAVICSSGGRTGHMESLCRSRGIPVLRVDRAELDETIADITTELVEVEQELRELISALEDSASEAVPLVDAIESEIRAFERLCRSKVELIVEDTAPTLLLTDGSYSR